MINEEGWRAVRQRATTHLADRAAASGAQLTRCKEPGSFHLVGDMPPGPTGKAARRRPAELALTHR